MRYRRTKNDQTGMALVIVLWMMALLTLLAAGFSRMTRTEIVVVSQQAEQARVRLRSRHGSLELDVEDHGKGLDPAGPRRGLGIVAMRERAEMLGGTIDFLQPAPGGTLVRLRVPLENRDADEG